MTTFLPEHVKALSKPEQQRVAAVVADDIAYRAERAGGIIDPATGEPRRVRPTDLIAQRRRHASNGMPEEETTDTIGKMWAWGLLDNSEFAADLLRDAGRRYAASYWRRYGPVCARSGPYSEMTGRSSGGPPSIVIPDEALDVLAEERFRARDAALCEVGRSVKKGVDLVCVDGAGDNDPSWLVDLMNGYPAETRKLRVLLADRAAALEIGDKESRRKATRLHNDARRGLEREIRELRLRMVPAMAGDVRAGLIELAKVDRAEGLHRPRRAPRSEKQD